MSSPDTETLISLDRVGVAWDRKEILSDINLDINRGDFMAITGPNGGGKTTLLRLILKLIKPTVGTVAYHFPPSLRIGYLPQKSAIDSRFPITVEEVVASGLLSSPLAKPEVSALVAQTIDKIQLADKAASPISNLSGGQLQRTLFGRAIIGNPDILIMDEPLNYLDKQFERVVYDIIDELRNSTTIIVVSHEMTAIAPMANRHLIVNHTLTHCHARHHIVRFDPDDCYTN